MNKKIHKLNKTLQVVEGREQLIARLEKLRERLDSPELTIEEFEQIKNQVQLINDRLKKSVAGPLLN